MPTRQSLLRLDPLQVGYIPSPDALRLFTESRDQLGVSRSYFQMNELLPSDEDVAGVEVECSRCGAQVPLPSLGQPCDGDLLKGLYSQLLEETAHPSLNLACCGHVISGLELLERLPVKKVSFAVFLHRNPEEGALPPRVMAQLEHILGCDLRPSWIVEESTA